VWVNGRRARSRRHDRPKLVGLWTEADVWNGTDLEYGSRGENETIALELRPDGAATLTTLFYGRARAGDGPRLESGRWGSEGDQLALRIYLAGDSRYLFKREASHLWLWRDDGTRYLLDYGFLPVAADAHPSALVGHWNEVGADPGSPKLTLDLAGDGKAERYDYDLFSGVLRWSADGAFLTVWDDREGLTETWKYRYAPGWLVLFDPAARPIYLRAAEPKRSGRW
jgi:hypothetical protein